VARNLILDWSGTVVDDLEPVLEATNAIFRHFGRHEMSREEFRREFRLPFSGFWTEHLPEAGLEDLEVLYHRFFAHLQDDVALLPGAIDLLEWAKSTGRRVFLLSTIRREHFETQATRLGVRDYFTEACVEAYDKRERIGELLRTHQCDPGETLFAGDMEHDIETARHGGVLPVAVLSGFDPLEKLLRANPPVILDGLNSLHRLLS